MKMKPSTPMLASALLAASLPASAFQLQHSEGTLALPHAPSRVVSFDLGVLDTLAALDIPVSGVPKSTYNGPLARYRNTAVIGTLFEPDYSALNEIRPDLIIASTRAEKAVPELAKLAPTVSFTSDTRDFMKSFRESNLALAQAFGKEQQAQAALAAIDRNVNALHEANSGKTAALLFTMKGNIVPHAPGDRFGYAYELTGTQSVLPPKDPGAPVAPRPEPGSPEARAAAEQRAKIVAQIAAADPDWLIVLDRGAINGGERTAADTLAKHPRLSQTRAFREGRVHYVDPNGWYVVGGGLNNLKAITDSLLAAMK